MERNRPFSRILPANSQNSMKQPRFSIHDAFEEENDEAIRVYGSTIVSNVPRPANSTGAGDATSNNGGASSSVSSVGSVSNNTTTNELSTLTCDR